MSHLLSADMAELADAPDLGSGVYDVQVQVLLSAVNGGKHWIFNGIPPCSATACENVTVGLL